MWKASSPVVVGVDGSDAAIDAAKWAIDEAISRDVPLRIVHVTHIEREPASPEDTFRLEVQYAESSLRAATAAVEANGKPVKIETEILWGSPDTALINESRNASMVCVGSVGIGAVASKIWGSTAASSGRKGLLPGRDHSVTSQRAGPGARLDRRRCGRSRRQRVGHRTRNERGATAYMRRSSQSASGKKTSAKRLTTNWTAGSKSGQSITPTSMSIPWPPGPASLGSWPITRTNRCS